MTNVVELPGKNSRAKPVSGLGDKAGDTAEIVIFPGVRYEREPGDDVPDPARVGR